MRTRLARTPDGRRWVVSRAFDRSPADAWRRLTDTAAWPEWGPSVAAVDFEDRRIERGSSGQVRLRRVGAWLPFEVTTLSWDGSAGRWTWRVARLPATGHAVDPVAGGGCRVSFEVPLLAAAYVPVCRTALDRF